MEGLTAMPNVPPPPVSDEPPPPAPYFGPLPGPDWAAIDAALAAPGLPRGARGALMAPVVLGLAAAAVVLAAPFASRRLRPGRHPAAAGPRPLPPAGAGAPPEPRPRGEVTGPFGYDNGVIIGDRP